MTTTSAHTEHWYPQRPYSIYAESLDAAKKRRKNLKRKYEEMSAEPDYDDTYEAHEERVIEANVIDGQPLEFNFGMWQEAIRVPVGLMKLQVRFLRKDGEDFADTMEDFELNHPAWLRENFTTNLIKQVDFIVGGKVLEMKDHDHIARYLNVLTMPKSREEDDWEKDLSHIQVQRRAAVNSDRANNQLAGLNALLMPSTLPANTVAVNNANIQARIEQEAYNELKAKPLLGSKIHRFALRLLHPIFQEWKFIPPATPYVIKVHLNAPANCFQCRTDDVPRIVIEKATMIDYLIRLSPEAVQNTNNSLYDGKGQMAFPLVRRVLSEFNLAKTRSVRMPRFITDTIPSRIAMAIIPTAAWRTNNPSQNPYDYQFPGIKSIQIKYGDKQWPTEEGGLKFNSVPNHPPPYSEAEIDAMVRTNMDAYMEVMKVYTPPGEVHKLATTRKDWLSHNFVIAFDMSALGQEHSNADARSTKFMGDITLDMSFSHENTADMMLIVMVESKNLYTLTVPTFTSHTDY